MSAPRSRPIAAEVSHSTSCRPKLACNHGLCYFGDDVAETCDQRRKMLASDGIAYIEQ